MKTQIRPLLISFILLTLLTGVLYPTLVTGLAQVIFPNQANGSLIIQSDQIIGSKLIGQSFSADEYFWGRPSATSGSAYNAFDPDKLTGSSGSNLGLLSQKLADTVQERVNVLQEVDPENEALIPVDLVTVSASGLDPHISTSAAYYQIPRVALARRLSEEAVKNLVDEFTEDRQFGFLGESRVNVLLINLALDGIE